MKVEVSATVNLCKKPQISHFQWPTTKPPSLITRNTRALVAEALGEDHSFERSAHVNLHMHQVSCAIRLDR